MRAVINVVIPVPGLSSIPDNTAQLISSAGLSAVITDDLTQYCVHIDRQAALSSMLAYGGLAGDEREDRLQVAINEARQRREQRSISKVAFVFEAEIDLPTVVPNYNFMQGFHDFSVSVDGIGAELIRKLRKKVNVAIEQAVGSAFAIIGYTLVGAVSEFGSAAFTVDDNSWITYNINVVIGSAKVIVPRKADTGLIERLESYLGVYRKNQLLTVCKLLTIALNSNSSELDRYLASWTAIEVFINKTFDNTFRDEANKRITDSQYAVVALKDVRYSLHQKFIVIASLLRKTEAERDIMLFHSLKKERDNFVHGSRYGEEFPTETIVNLLFTYLVLYLESNTARKPASA